jgi:AraC-like DNA-binding protein
MRSAGAWVLPAIVRRIHRAALARGVPKSELDAVAGPIDGDERVLLGRARALLRHAVDKLGDPALVWEVALDARAGDYGAYGFALQASADVETSLARGASFFPHVGTSARLETLSRADGVLVRLHPFATNDERGTTLGIEYMLAQIAALTRAVSGGIARPRAVRIAHPDQGHAARVRAILGVTPIFGALANEIEFDRALASHPLPRRDDDLAAYLDRELSRGAPREGLPGAVRDLLDDGATVGALQEARIARSLGMSSRTLRRRLAAEGTSIRTLTDQVRREIARALIEDPDVSLASLAARLGFSDQSALTRAFRRWTGRSPGAFRREGPA